MSDSFFFDAPSWGLLDKCTQEQLFEFAEHYGVDVADNADIKAVIVMVGD